MVSKVATTIGVGGATFTGVAAFLFALRPPNSSYPLLLILSSMIALAVYHAYCGGFLATTTGVVLLVAVGLMAGVFVNEMGGCPPVPGCRTTPLGHYLGIFGTAVLIGVGAYVAGTFLERELAMDE